MKVNEEQIKNRFKYKRFALFLISILFIGGIASYALWMQSFSVQNDFKVNTLNVTLTEEFTPPDEWKGEVVSKKVTYKNTGSLPAVIRVNYVEMFVKNNELLSTTYTENGEEKSFVDITVDNNWTHVGDWYYYNKILQSGETTTPFISEIKFSDTLPTDKKAIIKGATYSLSFAHEYLKSNEQTLDKLWGVSKEITVSDDKNFNIKWETIRK